MGRGQQTRRLHDHFSAIFGNRRGITNSPRAEVDFSSSSWRLTSREDRRQVNQARRERMRPIRRRAFDPSKPPENVFVDEDVLTAEWNGYIGKVGADNTSMAAYYDLPLPPSVLFHVMDDGVKRELVAEIAEETLLELICAGIFAAPKGMDFSRLGVEPGQDQYDYVLTFKNSNGSKRKAHFHLPHTSESYLAPESLMYFDLDRLTGTYPSEDIIFELGSALDKLLGLKK